MSSGNGITLGKALIFGDAVIYLRMSDFRDEDRTTFAAREEQLRDFAIGLGVPAERVRVAIENDAGNGGFRPASAYKRPVRVTTATGLVTMRTRRPVFARVLLELQTGKAGVLVCDDVSRIARDERDALDLIDACELGKASAFSPSEDSADGIGSLRITRGGTREEIRSFRERARAAHDYSADISDKVQRGRKRWAGKSYWGGRRPYGRMIDPAAPKHAKRLITVPEEAKVLQDAVTDVLDRGISLRAVAADLRGRGLRTVTGKPFSAVSLKDALLASHVAGLATCNGAQYDASSWLEPIIEPDRWQRLAAVLTDPARRTNPHNANAPRWLLSGHGRCGICGDGTTMHASGMGGYGPERGSAYRCDKGSHCATPAIPADQAMARVMIARLSQPDIADLLPAPEPRPEVDVKGLRAESRKLHAKRDDLARLLSDDVLTEAGVRQERKRIDAKLAQISTELAEATQIDLLPEDLLLPLIAVAAVLAGVPRQWRVIRAGAAIYAVGTLAAWLLPTAVGASADRLGELLAGPVLIGLAEPGRLLPAGPAATRRALSFLALAGAVAWLAAQPAQDLAHGNGPAYGPQTAALVRELRALHAGTARVEAVPQYGRWESYELAGTVPLARGWERQLDTARNPLFYSGTLTPAAYHAWLAFNAVRYVAISEAVPDSAARAEERLIRAGQPWLVPVWHDSYWRLYQVTGTLAMARPPASVTAYTPATITSGCPGRTPPWSGSAGPRSCRRAAAPPCGAAARGPR